MKVKSLLFAAAALLALNATAQYEEWTGRLSVSTVYVGDDEAATDALTPGTAPTVTIALELGNMPNFTLLEAHFAFPAGVTLDGVYNDLKVKQGKRDVEAFSWSYNMNNETEATIFANSAINKAPIELAEPTDICDIDFTIPDGVSGAIECFQVKAPTAAEYDADGTTVITPAVTREMPRFELIKIGTESAVKDVNVTKAVASVKYYNAAGVAADSAFDGVNIVVTKYADGTQSVTKVIK